MSRSLRSPLHPPVSDSVVLSTFVGSKTGEEYTTPVGYWVKDGHLIVTTQSPWWRNPRGGQSVAVQVRGQQRAGIAIPHPDYEDVARYIEAFLDRHGTDVARRLGIRIHGNRKPTPGELEAGMKVVIDIEPKVLEKEEVWIFTSK